MESYRRLIFGLFTLILVNVCKVGSHNTETLYRRGADDCKPLVIAHRGASGYVPEHTLGSYALAVTMGADYVEPDLVMTRDGHLIARHENELSFSTNVDQHPEFADRRRTQTINGRNISGWFSEDFTLEEIKTLRSKETMSIFRIANVRMNEAFQVPTFQEVIDLIKVLEISENRTIGICPEIKYGTHFQQLGLAMEELVVNVLHKNGYVERNAPAFIQSFEVTNLKQLKKITDIRLIQLYGAKSSTPYDQVLLGSNLTFGYMATPEGLANVATYASGVGPEKSYIIPRNLLNKLDTPTSFVKDAHALGLEVHPYTFRAENIFLPREYQINDVNGLGNLTQEIKAFIDTGIDGLFIDHPDKLISVRGKC
ncbi:unnamed protein product [Danaus chrysippus]|uniref:glycerophosphodiester phosphodiesterase n=1 Tax=Danaus chrysippus TaxID=151541 RepID=A0A8J2R2I5_9NEOP|nr:unnamed protein product [Danaus chrysippus]